MIRSIKITTEDRDLGFERIREAFESEGEPFALAGIRQDAGVYDQRGRESGDPVNVAEVAIVQEFGSLDGRIPSRPWVRSAWDRNQGKYVRRLATEFGKVVDGEQTAVGALDRVILEVERDQVESLIALEDPPNAPSTLLAKAPKTNPLVDTGQLAQSHDSAVFRSDGTPARPWAKGPG